MNVRSSKDGIFFLSKLLLVALFIVVTLTEIVLSEDKDNTLRMQDVINEALRMNPELQAAKLSWSVSTEKTLQERALDDPVLGFTY